MHKFVAGNIFNSKADALVDAVNCVGIKGAGLALQFKQRFPDSFDHYRRACRDGEIQPGKVLASCGSGGILIIHFPTKLDWRDPSRLEWIESGLEDLVSQAINYQLKSIAIPQLGCGLGGLQWSEVRPLIVAASDQLVNCHVEIYGDAPSTVARPVLKNN